jgi:hypothetical protein
MPSATTPLQALIAQIKRSGFNPKPQRMAEYTGLSLDRIKQIYSGEDEAKDFEAELIYDNLGWEAKRYPIRYIFPKYQGSRISSAASVATSFAAKDPVDHHNDAMAEQAIVQNRRMDSVPSVFQS